MPRLTDGQLAVRAVQYAQIDAAEGVPYKGIFVLQEQVRVMHRIYRLENYLTLLIPIIERAVTRAREVSREGLGPEWERVNMLHNRFIIAEDALHATERTMPS